MPRTLQVLALGVILATAGGGAAAAPIFVLQDAVGDDHGDGRLVYPMRPDYEPGELDLVELAAEAVDGGTRFTVTFARPVRSPDRRAVDAVGTRLDTLARFGFYTFNLDLYIDVDRVAGSGFVHTLPGRKAVIAPADAWEKVVALVPRPHVARRNLRSYMLAAFKEETRAARGFVDAEDVRLRKRQIEEEIRPMIFFPNQIRVVGRRVEFLVPDWFLPGGAASARWGYVVVVSAAQLEQRFSLPFLDRWARESTDGMILPVEPGRPLDALGGGREGDLLQPPLVDILVPPGRSQEEILGAYDTAAGRLAELPAVVPAEPLPLRGDG